MSEAEQKKKPPEKPKEGAGEDLSPPSPLPTEQKVKPPEKRVEIIDTSKPQEKTDTDVTIYKYTECPYCDNPSISYDPIRGVYYCGECRTAWQ